jgi:hypothetical protein
MKQLSIHPTKILFAVKERQQKYCETVYSRSGINHMWILKNSKDLGVACFTFLNFIGKICGIVAKHKHFEP